jgi:hypothetical protein
MPQAWIQPDTLPDLLLISASSDGFVLEHPQQIKAQETPSEVGFIPHLLAL